MDCLFCKIAKGKIPSCKIWENKEFLAILDICPNTKGMSLVLPKKHYSGYIIDMPENMYKKLMGAAQKVAKLLDKKLMVKRTAMVMEGMGVDHAHIKLYPLHGLDKKFKEMISEKKVYFEDYKGYLTTQMGPRTDDKELEELAGKIRE